MPTAFVPEMYAIDFGTSNSLLAAANRDQVCAPIPLDDRAQDPSVFRSILFYSDDGVWSYGAGALNDYVAHGMRGRFIRSIKRFLPVASFNDTRIGSRKVLLEELVGMFLREMRRRANAHFGVDVRRVMLGRPARFSDDDQADALAESRLRNAAAFAGFEDIHFCPEPLAAAYDFGRTKPGKNTFLVADFGAGTSDYTVARLDTTRTDALDVLALAGGDVLEFLRGVRAGSSNEEDKMHVDQLLVLIEDSLGFQIFEAIEHQKRELSTHESAEFRFEYPGIDIRENM